MPVTFYPAKKDIEPFQDEWYESQEAEGSQADRILRRACHEQYKQKDEILQSSFDTFSRQSKEEALEIVPRTNGFVYTILEAYNRHRALIIRPDDVWLAILTQFSAFVNANAEALRSQFVEHEGKKELTVTFTGDVRKVDYGDLAHKMTGEIEKNVTDPVLREWILPAFSTTELNDTIVSSIVMMATLKEYFSYKFMLLCGIPKVTLQGEKEDWEKVLLRLEKLKEYGLLTIAWYHLLRPVVARFVQAFEKPDAQGNLDFWQNVCHHEGGGSGPRYISGWITAFCVFNDKGAWMGNAFKENVQHPNPSSLTSSDFFSTFIELPQIDPDPFGFDEPREALQLDGSRYHRINDQDVPVGACEVDVLVVDASEKDREPVEFKCLMVAGQVGMRLSSSASHSEGGARRNLKKDTVEPVAGWWMFTKLPEGKTKNGDGEASQESPIQDVDAGSSHPDPAEDVPVTVVEAGKEPTKESIPEEKPAIEPERKTIPPESKDKQEQEHGAGCCKCVVM